MKIKKVLVVIISLPFLPIFILFDLFKLIIMMPFFVVIGGIISILDILKGNECYFKENILDIMFLGISFWLKEFIGCNVPKWMDSMQ